MRKINKCSETDNRIVLGTWNGITAYWGYNDDYEEEGLTLCDEDDEADEFFSDHWDEMMKLLYKIGSMGFYYLIYSGINWEQIPILCEFSKVYERWGC